MASINVRDDQLPERAGPAVEVQPVPAASVLVMRPPFDVLMIRRHERSAFAPNAWVFPGGVADTIDHEIGRDNGTDGKLDVMRITAARELFEETGLWLGKGLEDAEHKRRRLLAGSMTYRQLMTEGPVDFSQLVWTSHWITPVGRPKRFDTYFFLVKSPEGAVATAEHDEAVEVTWLSPAAALSRYAAGDFQMVFPTIKNLEALEGFASIDDLLAARRGVAIPVIQPVIVVEDGQEKVVLR